MSSSVRTEANRRNAAKSTGPRTAGGKAASAHNARQHGLSGGFSILAHEDHHEFQQLLTGYRTEWKPKSLDESFLVEQMAQARWTLARARRIESHLMNLLAGLELPADQPDACIAMQLHEKSGNALSSLQRYATTAERSYFRARRDFQQGRSVEMRNKANDAQNWLKEQLMGTPPSSPEGPYESPDESGWSGSRHDPYDHGFPGKH